MEIYIHSLITGVVTYLSFCFNIKLASVEIKLDGSTFGKSYLTHLITDVMFSGQRFANLAMFRDLLMAVINWKKQKLLGTRPRQSMPNSWS